MAYDVQKFLNGAGVTHLWEKIQLELGNKVSTSDFNTYKSDVVGTPASGKTVVGMINDLDNSLAAVAKSGNASDVVIADAGNLLDASNVEAALQEVATAINNVNTDAAVTVAKTVGGANDDFVTKYTFSQGGTPITNGEITIGKDLVATTGQLVNQDGSGNPGTFIEMTIANGTPFYINVADLIEYNTFVDSAEIDFTDNAHSVSASIVAGSIAKSKLASGVQASLDLADSAMQEIAAGSVTKAMLAQGVQDSIDAADSALQASDIAEGATNGTIAVKGTDVAVHGLGSAAFLASTAFDAAGEAQGVYNAIQALTNNEIDAAILAANA